jgi:hypothetical protein
MAWKYLQISNSTSLEIENANAKLNDGRRPHFIHIPKTGGTSFEQVLRKYTQVTIKSNIRYPVQKGYQCPVWHTPPAHFVADSVCIVRDPYSRFVSELCDRHLRMPYTCENLLLTAAKVLQKYQNWKSFSDCHFLPQNLFAQKCETQLRFERLSDDINAFMSSRFGIWIERLPHISWRKFSRQDYCLRVISCFHNHTTLLRMVRHIYKDDFQHLGYNN